MIKALARITELARLRSLGRINALAPLLVVSILAGQLAGYVRAGALVRAQTPGVQAPRPIPPVAAPPLYPDSPTMPMYWSSGEIERIYRARLAQGRGQGQGGPVFRGQSFRTHSIGAMFRVKYPTPQPSNRAGVMSRVDDADQHEGVTDFYVILGGQGQMVTGGEIQNRVYGHAPRSAFVQRARVSVVYPGEFNGQPILDGRVHDLKAGDWLAIPPNVPHWPGYEPGEGLLYMMLKVNLGYYPPNLMY